MLPPFLYKITFLTYTSMLRITRGQVNLLPVTLSENTTLTSPFYLLVLNNLGTHEMIYIVCSDTSPYQNRYNLLSIDESTHNIIEGTYKYSIYEQSNSTNLDPTLCDNTTPLEIGLLRSYTTATSSFIGIDYDNTFKWIN